jgi:hypothetical protein
VLQSGKGSGTQVDTATNITALTAAVQHAAQWTKDSQAAVAGEIGSTLKQGDPKVIMGVAGGGWERLGEAGGGWGRLGEAGGGWGRLVAGGWLGLGWDGWGRVGGLAGGCAGRQAVEVLWVCGLGSRAGSYGTGISARLVP